MSGASPARCATCAHCHREESRPTSPTPWYYECRAELPVDAILALLPTGANHRATISDALTMAAKAPAFWITPAHRDGTMLGNPAIAGTNCQFWRPAVK